MKENNVKSFEKYQRMISENKQQRKGSTRSLNDQNQILLTKKITQENSKSKKKLILSTKQQHQSPVKVLSPNRHRNGLHSPIKNVSYGELQVILQNIDSIKQKAKQQIEELQERNKDLESQLNHIKTKYQNAEQLEQRILKQHQQTQQKAMNSKTWYENHIKEVALRQRLWIQEKQQYIQEIINYKKEIELAETQQRQLNKKIHDQQTAKNQWSFKYQSLVNSITLNKGQRLPQLIYQLRVNYEYQSALDVITSFEKQIIAKQKEKEQAQNTIQTINAQLQNQRNRCYKNQQVIGSLMNQNKSLINKISQTELQHKQALQNFNSILEQEKNLNSSSKSEYKQLSIQHVQSLEQIEELNSKIKVFQILTANLKQQIRQHKQKEKIQKMDQRYLEVVQESCQDLQDLSKILNKLQMFQKCKIQNRTNIEKIQFLCKMLDY